LRLATTLRYLYLSYFSKPVSDRALYRILKRKRPRKILEIGIVSTDRTLRTLDFMQRLVEGDAIRYAAIDLFEARNSGAPKLSLKDCHRLLKTTKAQSQLIPGEPAGALARVANSLPDIDLVIISAAHDDATLAGAWFYLPRMLNERSIVLREVSQAAGTTFEVVELAKIRLWAGANRRRAA
jgi:hypothetical protein